jgi:thiol-disulfide isomerase/thioredoxin
MGTAKPHKESISTRMGRSSAPQGPRGAASRRALRRTALLATAAVVAVGIAAGIIVTLRPGGSGAPASAGPPADRLKETDPSLAELARAADAVGFQQTTGPSVGVVENLPVDTTLLPGSPSLLSVGALAPDFSLQTPAGQRVRLSDFRGRTILLEFFATWCPHCQAEVPHLMKLHSALPQDRFAFVSVNADSEDAASVYAFHRWFGIPWQTLLDPGARAGNFSKAGSAGPVTEAFGVALYPTFYIIDAKGRIAWRGDREKPDALLLRELMHASGT